MVNQLKDIAIQYLKDMIQKIQNDECDIDELSLFVAKSNYENHGYIHEDDYVTADEAMRILHIGNRNNFFDLIKKNNIKNKRINNQNIGYSVKEIKRLYDITHNR